MNLLQLNYIRPGSPPILVLVKPYCRGSGEHTAAIPVTESLFKEMVDLSRNAFYRITRWTVLKLWECPDVKRMPRTFASGLVVEAVEVSCPASF